MNSRISRRNLLGLAGAGALCVLTPDRARADDWPPAERLLYRIFRDGDPVGQSRAAVEHRADGVRTRNDTTVEIGFAGMVLYRYRHRSAETWDREGLRRIVARTDDDGKLLDFEGTRTGGLLRASANGRRVERAADLPTTNLWHPATPRARMLLDVEDGELVAIRPRALGARVLTTPLGDRRCQGHALGDAHNREVWYDPAGRLVRVDFRAPEDGSAIRIELAQIG